MRPLERRITRFEGIRGEKPQLMIHFVMDAGAESALSMDECLEILRDAGCRFRGPICQVNLLDVPPDLSATELERYLREHAAEIAR